ncbi:DUF4465 domain-containing protein [Flammeovirga sp. MY04]|uniref:DUF4465 domain-containing protein n=1 Tax=Flammeovirga sp. MY04 TaxID=1191459 RepID=UPI0008062615|nr:DUF4465 domain-containing protein [Flammeovirga sp. MY04]ANQ52780.1 DUF4465 domain-containing protein [Flammeovirga sp. MY04]
MNKQTKLFNLIVLLSFIIFGGCNKTNDESLEVYHVTFETDGGTDIEAQEIIKGGVVAKPENPEKVGYEFVEWTKDDETYDFKAKVENDFTLTANYNEVIQQFTVTFDPNNEGELTTVTVNEGEKIPFPEDPTKEKFSFNGWYNGDQPVDTTAVVTSDLTLTAKWVSLIDYVNLNDGTLTDINTYWWGKGGHGYDPEDCYDEKIIDGKIKISNLNFIDMMTKMGTAISNYDASSVDPDGYPANQLDIQYAAYPAKVEDGEQYLVMYKAPKSMGPTWNPDSLVFVNPVQLNTISFTNNAYGYLSMKQGDWLAKKFEAGDWFKVTVKGWDKDGNPTGTIDVSLAEGEDILDTWKAVDLSSLGVVSKLTFDMSSSDPAAAPPGDFNTPMYFCMKDISFFKDIDEE